MFDIGFTELLLCMVVALVVIGPEQLPGAVRTAGLWVGRLKRSLRDTRNEIERQIGADDIRRQLHNEEVLQNIEDARIKFEQTLLDVQGYETAEAEARRLASYGPPDELPDHAHGNNPNPAVNTPLVPAEPRQLSELPAGSSTAPAVDSQPTNNPQTTNKPSPSGTGH